MTSNRLSRKFSGFLEHGTSFSGDLRFSGTLRIDGNLVGSVSTPDTLVVGDTATLRANVSAGAVQVHGIIIGDVSCTHRIELCAGGRITGNIETPDLVIQHGAQFDGESLMNGMQPGEPETSAPPPVEADGKADGEANAAGDMERIEPTLTPSGTLTRLGEAIRLPGEGAPTQGT